MSNEPILEPLRRDQVLAIVKPFVSSSGGWGIAA